MLTRIRGLKWRPFFFILTLCLLVFCFHGVSHLLEHAHHEEPVTHALHDCPACLLAASVLVAAAVCLYRNRRRSFTCFSEKEFLPRSKRILSSCGLRAPPAFLTL